MADSTSEPVLADLVRAHVGGNFHIMAITILGLYDWILTLGRERQYIWRRATSNSAILFPVIRYASLATIPFTAIMSNYFPGKSDQWWVPSTCAVLCLTLQDIRVPGVIAARASSIVEDTLVIVATWVRMWPMRAQLTKRKLTGVMFTDGSLYFFVLLGANLVALALVQASELTYLLAQWISCFTVIFTCRFILDLHEAAASSSVAVVTRPPALPDSTGTRFSVEDSRPTLLVARLASMSKLDVSFGSMSIFGAMIPWIGRGESEGMELGGDASVDREKETFLEHRADSEEGSPC
ncbi:hypothetical protein LXA43DRAFT_1091907 [Ganoderma leucocontextum]|nr:hypothetical protein LXA43DRAFT_1091907 [Ganoderma leucocontextum]